MTAFFTKATVISLSAREESFQGPSKRKAEIGSNSLRVSTNCLEMQLMPLVEPFSVSRFLIENHYCSETAFRKLALILCQNDGTSFQKTVSQPLCFLYVIDSLKNMFCGLF